MFYVLFIILFVIIFILYLHHKTKHTAVFIFVLVAYFFAILSLMIYFSRDTYYYNIIKNYFYLPDSIWRKLFFLPISRFNIIRMMNLTSLCVILASVCFALSFQTPFSRNMRIGIKFFVSVYLLLQLFVYDPYINLQSYYLLYPSFFTSEGFYTAENIFYLFTKCVNNMLILFSILILAASFYHSSRIQLIRYNFLLMTVCFSTLSILYVFFISRVPAFLLRISKFAQSYYFWYIDLGNNIKLYYLLPFIFIIFLLLISFSLYKLAHINKKIEQEEFEIAKQIDATETTSKIFCHYVKNELLAIESELEVYSLSEASCATAPIQETIKRCQKLYDRIDEIHTSTKKNALHLIDLDLRDVINQSLHPFYTAESKIIITKNLPADPLLVLADPIFLDQALHNIICNAIDAMADKQTGDKALTINLIPSDDWVIIEIKDSGTGISNHNIKKIFTPFFSSKSTARHWGIGLSLTYRIIQAHEGKIEVESRLGEGTCFKILLPKINNIFDVKRRSDRGK